MRYSAAAPETVKWQDADVEKINGVMRGGGGVNGVKAAEEEGGVNCCLPVLFDHQHASRSGRCADKKTGGGDGERDIYFGYVS